jgi:hypothetical protein
LVPSAAASARFSAAISEHWLFVDPFWNGNKIGSLIAKRRLTRVESGGGSGGDRQIGPFLHQVDHDVSSAQIDRRSRIPSKEPVMIGATNY